MNRLPHVLLLAALAIGATACSDDAESSGGPSPEPTSEPTSSAAEPTTDPTSEPTSAEPTTVEPSTLEPSTVTPTPTSPPTPSEPPVDPDAAPTTYDAALARFDASGQEPQERMRFRTGNGIYCLLDSDYALGCELPRGGIPDADYCGDGPSQNVGRVVFADGGTTAECNSDTIREPGAPKVDFDTVAASSASGIECLVQAVGVTCISRERQQGFFLGKDDYTVF